MPFYELMVGILCVWRVTHLLALEDGPWDLLARWRAAAGTGFWGRLLGCFYCLSLWIAVPFAWGLGAGWRNRAMLWLALSGGAILLERATDRPRPAAYQEDPEDQHELLRRP